ncbi:MAG: hypothetical protein ACLQMO_14030 [Acidobacteriaceae bacterium]
MSDPAIQHDSGQIGTDDAGTVEPKEENKGGMGEDIKTHGAYDRANETLQGWRIGATAAWVLRYVRSSEFTNLAMALATVAIAISTYLTYKVVNNGSQDTKRLIAAADIQASAAHSFAGSAASINTGVQGAVGEMQSAVGQLESQVAELRKSAQESNRLAIATEETAQAAKNGIITNRNAIQLENRAWLGVSNQGVVQLETGKRIKADITLVNSGKTPASHVSEGMDIEAFSMIPSTSIVFGLQPTAPIPPQGAHIVHFISNAKLDGVTKAKIEGKMLILVLRGTVQYVDFNKIQRTTSICMFMSDPATKQLSFCETGNDMD